MENNFDRGIELENIKKELLKNGFIISKDIERDRLIPVTNHNRIKVKKEIAKILYSIR